MVLRTTCSRTPSCHRSLCAFAQQSVLDKRITGFDPFDAKLARHNRGDYHTTRLWSMTAFGIMPALALQIGALLYFCFVFFEVAQLSTIEGEIDCIDENLAARAIVNPLAFLYWFFQPEYSDLFVALTFHGESGKGGDAKKARRAMVASLTFVAIPNLFLAASWLDESPYSEPTPAYAATAVTGLYTAVTALILV